MASVLCYLRTGLMIAALCIIGKFSVELCIKKTASYEAVFFMNTEVRSRFLEQRR